MAQYLARTHVDETQQRRRHVASEGHERDDLVACGWGGLPAWAQDDEAFWAQADAEERQRGVVAWMFQVSLPRELSAAGRVAVAEDILATYAARYPHTWAVHCPPALDGSGDNPHLHLMLSARRDEGAYTRTPVQWFRRAASGDQPAQRGGVRKDPTWSWRGTPERMREGVATLLNAALEREGHATAISALSVQAQGHDRDVLRMPHDALYRGDAARDMQVHRSALLAQHRDWENDCNLLAWQEQKVREHLHDSHDRQAVIDHVRERFWQHDQSALRHQERDEALLRALEREYARTSWEWPMPPHDREQGQQQIVVPEIQTVRPRGSMRVTLYDPGGRAQR